MRGCRGLRHDSGSPWEAKSRQEQLVSVGAPVGLTSRTVGKHVVKWLWLLCEKP